MQKHSICAYLCTEAVVKSTVIMVVAIVVGFFSTIDKVIAQESILSTTNPTTWIYTYDNNNRYTEASSIVSTPNGDYIVAGRTSIFRQPNDFFLTKVNNVGINQWQKVFDYGSSDVDVTVIRSVPGSEEYIVLLNLSEGYTNIGIILRIDSSGNVIWQKKYDVDGNSTARLRDMIVTRSGDIFVVGSIPVNNQEMNGLIAKISQSGTVLWVKSYDNSYDESQFTKVTATESLNGVIELTDGSILAVGSISFDNGDKKERYLDSWVMKLDTTGTLLWQKSIGKLEDEFGHGFIDEYASAAIETSEGKYVIVGVSFQTKGPYPTCGYDTGHVFELDENGQLNWQKEYVINYDEICQSFIPTKVVAVGNDLLITSNPYDESMFIKITNNGSILQQHKYAPYKYNEGDRYRNYVSVKTALVDTEQRIILGGSAGETNTNWDLWLARTDAQGVVDSSCGRAEVSFDTNITVEEIDGTSPNYILTNVNTHSLQVTTIAALSISNVNGKADFLCYDIAGRVLDINGNPVAGATVTAIGVDITGSGSATSNLEGKFRIKSLNLGLYRVTVAKPGIQFQDLEATVPTNNILFTPGLKTYSVSGYVTYYGESKFHLAQNKGIDGVTIIAIKLDNNASFKTQTNAEGAFLINNLESGIYRIEVEKDNGVVFFTPYDSLQVYSNVAGIKIQGYPDIPGYILPYVSSYGDIKVTRTGEQYKWLYDLFGLTTQPSSFHDSTDNRSDQRGAIDWGLPEGAPLLAAKGGKVISVMTTATSYGCPIIIDHLDGTFGKYMHASQYRVQVGDYIDAGERIGNVGNRCGSEGAHIHFEVETSADENDQTEVGMIFNDKSALQTDGIMIPFEKDDNRLWSYPSDSVNRCPYCVTGHVYRGNVPLSGVKLYVQDKTLPTDNMIRIYYDYSSTNGSYEISVPPSDRQETLTIVPQSRNWQFDPQFVQVNVTTSSVQLDFFVATSPIKGYIRSSSGHPIINAIVTAYNSGVRNSSQPVSVVISQTTTSNSDGYYELQNLPKNDVYKINILIDNNLVASREIPLDVESVANFVIAPLTQRRSIYLPIILR